MKTSILRHSSHPASILTLEPSVKDGIGQLGLLATTLLDQQDPKLWADAANTDFLNHLCQGARLLKDIGHEKATIVAIEDWSAHRAFITCLFLAGRADHLCSHGRADLHLALYILAECCPVELPIKGIPPITDLAPPLQRQSIMIKHYCEMQAAGSHYMLTLADALRLLQTMERAPSFRLIGLILDLRELTEGFRTALRQTKAKKA
jgi:hypothetical protein